MTSDLDDTTTAAPRVLSTPVLEDDQEHTVVPGPALDPHMWPVEQAASAWPPAPPVAPAAPMFYGFRIGNSQIVLLDAVALVGRKPSAPRVVREGLPRLVRVQSATQEVSSTHLELRQVGTTVVATDLHSTNGTRLGVPGHPVRSLRPGESVVVGVGTLIDIGDRNVLEITPLQVRA